MNYQQQSLAGMDGVDLIVALYDGMVRFLYLAIEAIEAGDERARRRAIKRVFDILIHLQGRLRMDVGGRPAKALTEFYTAMFAMALQGSQEQSKEKLLDAIGCIRNVRDAWKQVAIDPAVRALVSDEAARKGKGLAALPEVASRSRSYDSGDGDALRSTRWMA